MKPLLKKDIESFLKRFESFVDSELRSINIISPSIVKITLATQDSARGFDWITLELEFNGISDAKLVENSKLVHVDMSDGVSLIFADNQFTFAISCYNSASNITNSICYIKATSIKYIEGLF
ncbi:MAG: hypothetical protein A2513_01230 [Sulfurimonas sp. RIFOXYD12_FULL_33_39]|uniref:hypothetical protein n=1 Tax=unclassified Sulfurimonas TaxID=2623549 RepID=UPI0008C84B3B|nr:MULTISPECIES: hypothetical protein [unclassified Sulfurimonas]OHE07491.1 MAG: hypothetical protein A3G74_08440 [Sulfurimonas sp. RIFCSPLOWO2_12_FULL_34_6]OHE10944.1 MAG: hypothetical protein A2513_01230 [Sulfurimonas sp. RIFOXYD12_FULL_33_39]OHE13287.1 MAG: hypothetical protein A2530_06955 [Sulfurimonas sp. RIFOXYD2_FULL_34_21]DAB27572.1 MAG TPA: hypothetical protein CFH78_07095 [Sulfurimonas sp. UBA10385]